MEGIKVKEEEEDDDDGEDDDDDDDEERKKPTPRLVGAGLETRSSGSAITRARLEKCARE